jgi:hypothetical protein
MVGQSALNRSIGVRIPGGQPTSRQFQIHLFPQAIPVSLCLILPQKSLGSLVVGLRLPEAIAKANGEDGKEAGVAQVVIVAHFEGGEVMLEAGILTDGRAARRG